MNHFPLSLSLSSSLSLSLSLSLSHGPRPLPVGANPSPVKINQRRRRGQMEEIGASDKRVTPLHPSLPSDSSSVGGGGWERRLSFGCQRRSRGVGGRLRKGAAERRGLTDDPGRTGV